jgi:2-methylcitrate dehydratase
MGSSQADNNKRPEYDALLTQITEYVVNFEVSSELARETAYYCLLDSLSCMFLALKFPECRKMLGPVVPDTVVPHGSRVPGTPFRLDPLKAAFDIGTLVRWLDFNDTWLAAEWGHPSDNLGALLAVTDFVSQQRRMQGNKGITVRELLTTMIKAHEIQGVLALENCFNGVGLDHVLLVKVASTALATQLLGGGRDEIAAALSQAWIDGQSLRTYRHAPNAGPRKSWAAGDASRRGVQLAMLTLKGEIGYPSALTAPRWGFQDVLFGSKPVVLSQALGTYVMENILFKISFPAEFHAQTAVEAAFQLHSTVANRLDDISRIELKTQKAGTTIISKVGPLNNPADRDHCLQYMVAVALIYGSLTAEHYEDNVAANPQIDALRDKMTVTEEPEFTRDYFDPAKRAIGNAIKIVFSDGSETDTIRVDYPVGHKVRRKEGFPLLLDKFRTSTKRQYPRKVADSLIALLTDRPATEALEVDQLLSLLASP